MRGIQSLTFDTTGLQAGPVEPHRKVWFTPDGDGISLHFFDKPPDLPTGMRSLRDLQNFYLASLKSVPTKLVEASTIAIGGRRAVRLVIKSPQQPTGMTYVGSLTFPYRDFSFVLKAQCLERGMTGVREAVLFPMLLAKGTVRLEAGKIVGDWKPDAVQFDAQFPNHPLSRIRKLLKRFEATASVEPAIRREAEFALP